jgi:hypothetical protein
VGRFGTISVRIVKARYISGPELIRSTQFELPTDWNDSNPATILNGIATVAGPTNITQVVAIEPGQHYMASVDARCAPPSRTGRVQISWLNEKRKHVSTTIRLFSCSNEWHQNTELITAPRNAVFAEVFGTSHDEHPIQIRKISFQ